MNKTIIIMVLSMCLVIAVVNAIRQDQKIGKLRMENENWQVEWKRKALENFKFSIQLDEIREYNLFQQALNKIDKNDYSRDYNCYEFTKDLQQELRKLDIKSSIAINRDRTHAWLLVWVEATKGNFIGIDSQYEIMEIRDNNLEEINL